MIGKDTHTIQWIDGIRAGIGRRGDRKLIEKVICALILLERMQQHGFGLIFKGGTSILLSMETPARFSIDIDIITDRSQDELLKLLEAISKTPPFHGFKVDNERKSANDVPVRHYKLYYSSIVDNFEEPILLDVLFEANPYPVVREIPIAHPWLIQEGSPISVTMPTYEAILGDKLTAFAPKTTGILYSKDRPVEIIKQLFDIGLLFDYSVNFKVIKDSFIKIATTEIGYRQLDITWEQVLEDSFAACFELLKRDEKSQNFQQLHKGLRNIVNFVIPRFHIDEAIIAGSKVAFLAGYLKSDKGKIATKYKSFTDVIDLEITRPEFLRLNRMKKTNPEAFFYWHHAISFI